MKNTDTEKKCKICGKTIVGKNITSICSGCQKKGGDKAVRTFGIIGTVLCVGRLTIKTFTKKD